MHYILHINSIHKLALLLLLFLWLLLILFIQVIIESLEDKVRNLEAQSEKEKSIIETLTKKYDREKNSSRHSKEPREFLRQYHEELENRDAASKYIHRDPSMLAHEVYSNEFSSANTKGLSRTGSNFFEQGNTGRETGTHSADLDVLEIYSDIGKLSHRLNSRFKFDVI